jgi:photosystem II stability/assembly factor-like uncharacterized protein
VKHVVILCAILALVVTGCGSGRPRPLPARFVPVSLSALGDRDFFLLGTMPCSAGRCYAIERTADGGRTFARLPAPAGLPTQGNAPSLRMADRQNGFVWVPFTWGAFWSTHDGGKSWVRLPSPSVVSFTTSGRHVYAVVARCTIRSCRSYRFAHGATSATHWGQAPLSFEPDGPVLALAAHGLDVWLLGTPHSSRFARHDLLARSTDGGRTFTTGAGPCVPGLGGELESSSTRVVWAVCATGMMAGASRSTDGGTSFTPMPTPPLVNAAQIAPASDRTAVLALGGVGRPLYRTTDSGHRWRPVGPTGKKDYWYDIAFTDRRVAEALVEIGARRATVWRTTNAGATWSEIRQR